MHTRSTPLLLALTTAALLALAGCTGVASSPSTVSPAGDTVSIQNAWVKATDGAMSAAFGELINSGTGDVTIVSATSPESPELQLHETTGDGSGEMVMQQKEDGFTIPAGGTMLLEPGGNHIMLMGLTAPIKAGDEVSVTLVFSDGSSYEFTAPAKDYSAANETYDDGTMNMGGEN